MSAPKKLSNYVLEKWTEGNDTGATLENPATAEVLATASTAGLDFSTILKHGRDVGGKNLRAMTFAERAALVKTLSKALYEAREELIELSIENGGSTRGDAKFDIDGATGTMAAYAAWGKTLGDTPYILDGEGEQLTRSARFFGYHIKLPRPGVAVHLNAFNFPAWGLGEKLAPALLAGMPVVTKPAPQTALVAQRCMELMLATGALPEGALQFVCGDPQDMLDHLEPMDVLSFTGGSATAKKIRAHPRVVETNVRVNVEADSVNAVILGADVDLKSDLYGGFLRHVLTEMTQKAGQKCTGTRRILVPAALADQVQSDIAEELAGLKVGNPKSEGVRVGPLTSKAQQEAAFAGIDKLVSAGAQIVAGGPKVETLVDATDAGYFVGPTLLRADGAAVSAVHAHEVFAPCSTLMPYESDDDASALVAQGQGGLVCTVYATEKERIAHYLQTVAPFHGRLLIVNDKTVDASISPGVVLPSCIHGGPGRAGGGEELGGLRALDFYLQRTAVQGDRGQLERIFGLR